MDDIEERLRSHAQAFDGLLSLIPAKHYYGEDGSEQWKRKKQTKEQAREAKRAKLDPESAKTAKDVMDENARKRKRDEERKEDDSSDSGELGSEIPKEGLKRGDAKPKKQKQGEDSANAEGNAAKSNEEAEARKKLKEEKKAQKKANQKEKKKAKDAARKAKEVELPSEETKTPATEAVQKPEPTPAHSKAAKKQEKTGDDSDNESPEGVPAEELSLDFNAEQEEQPSSASSPNSPEFDASENPQSGSSSISSIAPPTDASKTSSSEPKPLKATPDQLKERLQKRLDALRAARHADGLNGQPARNRQELIEARRQKAEQRKAHKKLLRQKAKEEEEQLKDEAMARRFSPGGSGSLLASPRSPTDSVSSNNYAFGRVVFGDGQQADPTLSNTRDQPKQRQGTHDPAAALKAVEAKKAKLAAMDEEKRADIEEKDMWLNAKKRAHGERVRDDTSLLKKALKRKETAKKKSEREWKERLEAVKRGKDMKQQRREDNLRKRRDEKGNKGKKPSGGAKKKSRPGFEGSFKAKSGGGKK
ncbi:SURF6-domain-containing protein [Aspergillus ellipticus CBS 707.79]|uniref:SURF6-domain-containing protein n=1 Tax=Aspergillus ellipticus CBS 707.79 TaxID=1448320 RepID=A0A319F336_9EURO|nr:SURF6-domain-containing protein [Aspergillus ellipticus CBS 707.79]